MEQEETIHKRVMFEDKEYWRHGDLISPIDHFSEYGELLADALRDLSYAVIVGNEIRRYGQKIGDVSDLVDVE